MKRSKLLIPICIILTMTLIPVVAYGQESSQTSDVVVNVNALNYSSDQLTSEVNRILEDTNVDGVFVYNMDTTTNQKTTSKIIQNTGGVQPQNASPVYYSYENITRVDDYTGSTILAVATGGPGITLSIVKTASVANTHGATFGATLQALSVGVGWNVTDSTSISIGGSAVVPSTHNNKAVKTMSLKAKAIYKVKEYDVYLTVPGYIYHELQGSGNAKKAYGVYFYRTYVYK